VVGDFRTWKTLEVYFVDEGAMETMVFSVFLFETCILNCFFDGVGEDDFGEVVCSTGEVDDAV
jgi:hypothetical protein